jgi:hypothetical protein
MEFTINEDIVSIAGEESTWVAAGTYNVVRYLDKRRLIIDITEAGAPNRQIAVVAKNLGTLTRV